MPKTTHKKTISYFNSSLRWSRLTVWHHFGNSQTCLASPGWNDRANFFSMDSYYINLPLYFKSFEEYCSLNNHTFWLEYRLLKHNSRTRFFPTCNFHKKVKDHPYFHLQLKIHMTKWDFYRNPKSLISRLLMVHLRPYWLARTCFLKIGVATFLTLYDSPILCKKSGKTYEPLLRFCVAKEQTNGQMNGAKFQGHLH